MKSLLQNSICLFFVVICSGLQLHAQTIKSENENSISKPRIEVFAQYNINFSPSTTQAFSFSQYYAYNGDLYQQFSEYYPLLIQLNTTAVQWNLKNLPEVGIRSFWSINKIILGCQLSLSKNISSYTAISEAKGGKAELFFEGSEWRTTFQLSSGIQFNRLSLVAFFSPGLSFARQNKTNLRVTESNGTTHDFANESEDFYRSNLSVGAGIEMFYELNSTLIFGARYAVYRVNLSAEEDVIDLPFSDYGYWNNMVGLSLGYRFKMNK